MGVSWAYIIPQCSLQEGLSLGGRTSSISAMCSCLNGGGPGHESMATNSAQFCKMGHIWMKRETPSGMCLGLKCSQGNNTSLLLAVMWHEFSQHVNPRNIAADMWSPLGSFMARCTSGLFTFPSGGWGLLSL